MTVTYIYKGYGITDENGIAKLDHDAQGNPLTHSYTGTGAGEIDIVASLDSTIGDSSIVSETYSLLDALFYDEALTNEKWNSNYADVTTNREIVSDGTILYYSAESGTKYCNTVIGSTKNWFDSTKAYQVDLDFTYERDNTNCAVGIGFGSNGYNIHNHFNGALTGSGHYKIITDGNTYQFYLDDVAKGSPITINGNNGLFFMIYRTGSLTFKNLTIIEI